MSHGRQQQQTTYNRPANVANSRQIINNAGGHVINTRPNHPASAQSGQQIMMTQPFVVNYPYDMRHFQTDAPMFYSYPGVIVSQQQRPSNHHLQAQMASSMANMASVGGAAIHQGSTHQALATISPLPTQSSPHAMASLYAHQMPQKQELTKRQRNPLPIVNPNTGEQVVVNENSSSSGSNQHSSALKLEPPPPTPQQQQQ